MQVFVGLLTCKAYATICCITQKIYSFSCIEKKNISFILKITMNFLLSIKILVLIYKKGYCYMKTLKENINGVMQEFASHIPKEHMETLNECIKELVSSRIINKALKVYTKAVDFTLPDTNNQLISLNDKLKRGPVILKFYRGIWCPICNTELVALQEILPEIKRFGATLLCISPQTIENSWLMKERNHLDFDILSDTNNKVARKYGLVYNIGDKANTVYHQLGIEIEKYNDVNSDELPIPATYLINTNGTVVYAKIDPDYTNRPEPVEILRALENLKTVCRI